MIKTVPASPRSPKLAEKYLPSFQFHESHGISGIGAMPYKVLDAVQHYDDRADPLLANMLRIRELPARLANRLGSDNHLGGRERFGLGDFLLLERNETEIAFGLVGHFWRLDFGLVQIHSREDFLRFKQAGVAKLVLSFCATPGTGSTHLTTETRVYCPDRRSHLLFAPYWLAIRLGSGLIRRRILKAVKRAAEQSQPSQSE